MKEQLLKALVDSRDYRLQQLANVASIKDGINKRLADERRAARRAQRENGLHKPANNDSIGQ